MELNLKPTIKQAEAWGKLLDYTTTYLLFGGGAGGGKSWLGCEWLLAMCYRYPGSKWFIGRTELKRLKQSTYITWKKVCKFHNIPIDDWKLNSQENYIEINNGSRIDLLDVMLQPRDPEYERFGSIEYTGGWLEEASEINFGAFDVLKTRIGRHLNREMNIPVKLFLTCNPKKNWLYRLFYKGWKSRTLPEDYQFIQSLYGDNPFTADSYDKQLSDITDKSKKQRLKFGNWEYDDDDNALMDSEAILDIFTNTVKESKEKFMSVDIARKGKDKTVIRLWKGLDNYKTLKYSKQLTNVTAKKIKELAKEEKIPYSHIVIDEDGVGGGVVDQLYGVKGFINNSTPFQTRLQEDNEGYAYKKLKPNYPNLKTQCYYLLAEYVNEHKICVSNWNEAERDLLEEELSNIKSPVDKDEYKMEIVSKKEMKELLGRSPDDADSFMMRMYFEFDETIITYEHYDDPVDNRPVDPYSLINQI